MLWYVVCTALDLLTDQWSSGEGPATETIDLGLIPDWVKPKTNKK